MGSISYGPYIELGASVGTLPICWSSAIFVLISVMWDRQWSCVTWLVEGHVRPYSLRGHVGPLVVIVTIHPLRSFEVIAWNYRVCLLRETTSMFSGLRWNSATWMVSLVDGIRIEFSIQEKWAQSFPHFDRLENDYQSNHSPRIQFGNTSQFRIQGT